MVLPNPHAYAMPEHAFRQVCRRRLDNALPLEQNTNIVGEDVPMLLAKEIASLTAVSAFVLSFALILHLI